MKSRNYKQSAITGLFNLEFGQVLDSRVSNTLHILRVIYNMISDRARALSIA